MTQHIIENHRECMGDMDSPAGDLEDVCVWDFALPPETIKEYLQEKDDDK